jgi:hypothetical protein
VDDAPWLLPWLLLLLLLLCLLQALLPEALPALLPVLRWSDAAYYLHIIFVISVFLVTALKQLNDLIVVRIYQVYHILIVGLILRL